jgi:hypothetical protein
MARKPTTVASRNNVITTRIFRGTQRIILQQSNFALGGVEEGFEFTSGIGNYPGSSYISNNHEQYRVVNIKVMAKPSIGQISAPSSTLDAIRYQNLTYNICNQTEIQSFVDYDSNSVPINYTSILQRPNLKIRGLSGDKWIIIGDYAPKAISNPSGGTSASRVFNTNEWMTTQNLDIALHGLRGYASCRAPAFTISGETGYPAIDIILVATVQMRGNKNEETSTLRLPRTVGPTEEDWVMIEDIQDQDEDNSTRTNSTPLTDPEQPIL